MKSSYKINIILSVIFLVTLILVLTNGTNAASFIKMNTAAAFIHPWIWANLTFLGDTLTACAIMLLFIRKRPDLVWAGIIATIVATLVVNLLKSYIDIQRPPAIIDKNILHLIGPALYNHSFPSGHTTTIFTLTGILMFYFRSFTVRLSLICLAVLIGISRIAVGVHWPADVLAGAALGALVASFGVLLVDKLKWNKNKPAQLIAGFLLIGSVVYLLVFYDSKYEQARLLQYIISAVILVVGSREYYFILRKDS
jgi:membrane-associated phospholipid phosphatase